MRKGCASLAARCRKLTPQEVAEKRERKVIGDRNGELQACLFRIESLSDKRLRFKVSVNAQEYHLVGRVGREERVLSSASLFRALGVSCFM